MANTTNFGWETPDDTDLVKDGAAAMRTLGSAIDTSFVDLKGGTTGQNLRKASNTDLDFTWAGDATNTVVDAAGDLLYGTASDTLGRLAIGTANQVLRVNSGATAPEWASLSSGGMTSIASGTLSTGSGTLALSTISGSYKDLILIIRDIYPATDSVGIKLTVNAITDYDDNYIVSQNDAAALATEGNNGQTAMFLYYNALKNTNDQNTLRIHFPDYADTTSFKHIYANFNYQNASTNIPQRIQVFSVANTAAAITDITISTTAGSFGAAGTYVLYGVN